LNALHWMSAAALGTAYARRVLSPVDVVQALLARVAAKDGQLHAFIHLDGERALEAARQAERDITAGRILGPLHGVPVGIKDIIDVAGQPTTCHSKIMLDHVAATDAEVVRRLRGAGAILLGKLALHEFAVGGPVFDLPFPPARNPWNTEHHPGGSSSGAGVAVAAGLLPLALGTDTGGSVRNPAGACGVVGLKPTYGVISRRGVFPLAFTLDHVGPLARCVDDAALLLEVIAGHDPGDPGSVAVAHGGGYSRDLQRGLNGLRIGFVRHFHESDMVADPEVAAALDEAARVLAGEGAEVRNVTLPPLAALNSVQRVIVLAESWAIHARWLRQRPGDYAEATRRRLMAGAFLSAGDYVQAQQLRARLMAAVDAAFDGIDVLLTANTMDPPCRIDDTAAHARTQPRQARCPFNLTGHPALAMMCGLSRNGLPLSLQFVGRNHDEATLMRVAAGYERAAGWHLRHPAA